MNAHAPRGSEPDADAESFADESFADDGAAEGDDPDAGADEGRRPARHGFSGVAVALAVAVGLLLGYAAGWLTPRLTEPGDSSAEAGFTRDMIFHHAQAVEMGLIGFQKATDPAVRQIAVDIATTQQGEIGMMHAWLRDWNLDPTGSEPAMAWMPEHTRHGDGGSDRGGLMPGMADADEMATLRAAMGKQVDVLFLQFMLRHHLGGVHMIDAMLAEGGEQQVVRAAQTMKNVQKTELANLEQLLTAQNASPLPFE